jgi:hypothetical protein
MNFYLSSFITKNVNAAVGLVGVEVISLRFEVFSQFVLLFFQDGDSCFEPDVLL